MCATPHTRDAQADTMIAMTYETPKLGYPYNALEPVMSEETLRVHHGKHHTAYTAKLNAALKTHPQLLKRKAAWLLANLDTLPEAVRTPVRNFGGGHVNHAFFWTLLKKGVVPTRGPATEAITRHWGSLGAFKKEFAASATSVFGSGWTWLVRTMDSSLEIINTQNQDSPLTQGKTPLLVLDVWEHAYYLQYKQDRARYIKDFWTIVNWDQINAYFISKD